MKTPEEISEIIVFSVNPEEMTENSRAVISKQIAAAIRHEREQRVDGNTSDGYHTFNELYEHRVLLWINLCLNFTHRCYWRPHYEGWPLLGMETDFGQITYHVSEKYLYLFKNKIKQGGPEWDGHEAKDVVNRLTSLTKSVVKPFEIPEFTDDGCDEWLSKMKKLNPNIHPHGSTFSHMETGYEAGFNKCLELIKQKIGE